MSTMKPNLIGKHFLLVDDDETSSDKFTTILKDVGAEARVVKDLPSAHKELSHDSFDCILLDFYLPSSNGLSTIERTVNMASGIPVVIISEKVDDYLVKEAMIHGAMSVVSKTNLVPIQLLEAADMAVRSKETTDKFDRVSKGIAEVKHCLKLRVW